MKTKEGKNERNFFKITPKRILIFLVVFVFVLFGTLFYYRYFVLANTKKIEVNIEPENEIKFSNAKRIEVDNIIAQNVKENQKEEFEKQDVELEYLTTYRNNSELEKGKVQVVQEGRTGRQELIIKKTYENGELISEEQVSAKVTKASFNKIVEVGTSNKKSTYKVKVGDSVYVTSTSVSVMLEPNENSEKIAMLPNNTALIVLEITNDWYRISSSGIYGWVKIECTKYNDPNISSGDNNTNTSNSVKSLSFNMSLNSPSGLSLDQFKKILSDSKDTNGVMQNNAEYFYYIESQYNINGVFVAAMAIHESAWGTSQIANDKKNLFGYGAYDSNPYNGAYDFSTYSESIDLIARVLVKYYLNPAGTSIYGGEKAVGTYYNGSTLSAVNKCYASDSGWANKVYQHMQYLYKKL